MTTDNVEPLVEHLPIRRLKSVSFSIEGREQNAEKPSRWGRSRRGAVHKFTAVAVDGQVKEYVQWRSASTLAPSSVIRFPEAC
jgi:hypothetical protein